MAVTQLAPIAPEKWTPYDEFNVVIPRETFPAEGDDSPRSAGYCEQLRVDGLQSHAQPVLIRNHVCRAGGGRGRTKRICTRIISITTCIPRCTPWSVSW